MVVINTPYKPPPRRNWIWKSLQDTDNRIVRSQIDYFVIGKRYRNCIKSTKTYQGADIASDHKPVLTTLRLTVKRIKQQDQHSAGTTRSTL